MRTKQLLKWMGGLIFTAVLGTGLWLWWGLTAAEPDIVLPTFEAIAAVPTTTPTIAADVPDRPPTQTAATFTPIPSITNTPPPNTTPTPTSTPTLTPPATPTSRPQPEVTVALGGFLPDEPTLVPEATPVEQIEMPRGITNVLLVGSDTPGENEDPQNARTDSLIIVSINREDQTASMLSIPRDLYVYVPGWWNSRINTAYGRGNSVDYPGGGMQLLKDTVLYNFGIPIHYHARISFSGFEKIVDALNGIEIVNSCPLTDWRLKEPGIDIYEEDNYEMYTLDAGVHEMSGFMALWYARSRRSTSDFDRGRRQQQILGAILSKGVDLNLMAQIPSLWTAYEDTVETDMDLGKMLQLAAIAPAVRENGIQHLYLTQGEIEAYTTPEEGAQVQVLVPEVARETFSRLYEPPELNRGTRRPIRVRVVDRSGIPDAAVLAAENLEWFGFEPVPDETATDIPDSIRPTTSIAYYGNNFKGSYNWLVSWIFNRARGDVVLLPPEETANYDYEVVLGEDFESCRNPLYAPRP